jgi:hypothetical protein
VVELLAKMGFGEGDVSMLSSVETVVAERIPVLWMRVVAGVITGVVAEALSGVGGVAKEVVAGMVVVEMVVAEGVIADADAEVFEGEMGAVCKDGGVDVCVLVGREEHGGTIIRVQRLD